MLEITDAAIAWLLENRTRNRIPASFGVRIFVDPESGGLTVRSAVEPRANEQAIDRGGLRFFVAPETAHKLAGGRIDITHAVSGDRLLLRRRASTAASAVAAGEA